MANFQGVRLGQELFAAAAQRDVNHPLPLRPLPQHGVDQLRRDVFLNRRAAGILWSR